MTTLLVTTFMASLAGSLHCAGMCGPLMVVLRDGGRWPVRAVYHLGRVVTYGLLGVAAGALGHGIETRAAALGLAQGAAVFAALALAVGFVLSRPVVVVPNASRARLSVMRSALAQASPPLRGFLFGCATGLMPCGWLYAWLAVAAASGSAGAGGVVMSAFALGSVPALVASNLVLSKLGRLMPGRARVAQLALMGAAVMALVARTAMIDDLRTALGAPSTTPLVCHGG